MARHVHIPNSQGNPFRNLRLRACCALSTKLLYVDQETSREADAHQPPLLPPRPSQISPTAHCQFFLPPPPLIVRRTAPHQPNQASEQPGHLPHQSFERRSGGWHRLNAAAPRRFWRRCSGGPVRDSLARPERVCLSRRRRAGYRGGTRPLQPWGRFGGGSICRLRRCFCCWRCLVRRW